MSIGAVIAIVMLAELGLHYFPWRLIVKGELPRIVAYVLGVLGLMIPFTLWLWANRELDVIFTLWLVIGAGGLMVMALYGLDKWLSTQQDLKDATEREQVMSQKVRERHVKG